MKLTGLICSEQIKAGHPPERPAWLGSLLLMWRTLTQYLLAASDPLAPAPCPLQTSLHLQSPPTTTSSRDFCAGYLRIWYLSENMMMKHLCFDSALSFAAGFNVLYIPMWLLFLHCVSFIELVNANHCWDVIHFLPAGKMSVRQEGTWSLVPVL